MIYDIYGKLLLDFTHLPMDIVHVILEYNSMIFCCIRDNQAYDINLAGKKWKWDSINDKCVEDWLKFDGATIINCGNYVFYRGFHRNVEYISLWNTINEDLKYICDQYDVRYSSTVYADDEKEQIYFIGGLTTGGKATQKCSVMKISNQKHITLPSTNFFHVNAACLLWYNRLYVLGSTQDQYGFASSKCEYFDLSLSKWIPIRPFPADYFFSSSAVIWDFKKDIIILFTPLLPQLYSIRTDTWITTESYTSLDIPNLHSPNYCREFRYAKSFVIHTNNAYTWFVVYNTKMEKWNWKLLTF